MFRTEKDLREYLTQTPALRIKKKETPKNGVCLPQVKTGRKQEVTWSSAKSIAFLVDSMDLNPALLVTEELFEWVPLI